MFYVLGYGSDGQLMLLTRREFKTRGEAEAYRDSVHMDFRAFVTGRL